LLGQIQSEGTKIKNNRKLEFGNKSIKEHQDFIYYLNYLGIPSYKIRTRCTYHSSIDNIDFEIKKFEKLIGFKIIYKHMLNKSKGGFTFHTFLRNVLFYNIVINSLNIIRTKLADNKWDDNMTLMANGFLAKILSGDGNIEIMNKNRKTPYGRIKISDGNLNYLKDYKSIMEKYGFKPKIDEKYCMVRSGLNKNLINTLISIGAFENNKNQDRLRYLASFNKCTTNKNLSAI